MRKTSLVCLLLPFLLVSVAVARDHVAFHVEKSGLQKFLKATVSHYLSMKNSDTFVIDGNQFSGNITQRDLESNPLMKTLNQYLHITGGGDVSYTLKWARVEVKAGYDEENIRVTHSGSGQVFESALGIDFDRLQLSTPRIEICEYYNSETGVCDERRGFYGRLENVTIYLKDQSILTAVMSGRVDASGENIGLTFQNVSTNLKGERNSLRSTLFKNYARNTATAQLDFNFENFYMPPPVLVVGGEEIELAVPQIQEMILAEKDYIAGALTSVIGRFLAKDLVNIVNNALLQKLQDFKSRISLVNYSRADHMQNRFAELSETDPEEAIRFLQGFNTQPGDESGFFEKLKYVLRSRIHTVKSYCELDRVETKEDKDISLFFDSFLEVNHTRMSLNPRIHNGRSHLGNIDFSHVGHDADFAIGLSESYINALMGVAARSKVMTSLFNEMFEMPGVSVVGLNVHFIPHQDENTCRFDQIKVVANVNVKISELETGSFWSFSGIGNRISNGIGSLLEGDEVWFPVEIDLDVVTGNLANDNKIVLVPSNPFGSGEIRNSFGYPLKDMWGVVESSVFEKLKETIQPSLAGPMAIDLTDHLDAIPGMKINPKYLRLSGQGHIVLGVDFHRLNITELQEELNKDD